MWFLFHYFCRKTIGTCKFGHYFVPIYFNPYDLFDLLSRTFCLPVASSFITFFLRYGQCLNQQSKKFQTNFVCWSDCSLQHISLWEYWFLMHSFQTLESQGKTRHGNSHIHSAHEDRSRSQTFLASHRDLCLILASYAKTMTSIHHLNKSFNLKVTSLSLWTHSLSMVLGLQYNVLILETMPWCTTSFHTYSML